jgi:hypothetical protein
MRKSVTTILFGALLVFEAGAKPAQSGEATFKLTNNARFNIMVKVFSHNRDWQWPNSTTHWNLNDGAQHDFRIGCQDGEKVCWGGSYTADNATYWGVGFKGDKGCQDCCLTCGSNPWHSWTLNDGPGQPAGGQAIDPGSVGVPVRE